MSYSINKVDLFILSLILRELYIKLTNQKILEIKKVIDFKIVKIPRSKVIGDIFETPKFFIL